MNFLPIRIMAGLALLSCSIINILIIKHPILFNTIAYKLILYQNLGTLIFNFNISIFSY